VSFQGRFQRGPYGFPDPGAQHITTTNSTYYIHNEQPQLLTDAIRKVVDADRDGAETVGNVEGAE
jgi:hypothetical protein